MASPGNRRRLGASVTCLIAASLALPSMAFGRDGVQGGLGDEGAVIKGLSETQLRELGSRARGGVAAPAKGPWAEFASTSYCTVLPPGSDWADLSCTAQWTICAGGRGEDATAVGPAVNVWRRWVNATGDVVDDAGAPVSGAGWSRVGFTCLPQLVPGAARTLTMADVVAQFHDTVFAKAGVAVQPVGGVTLVNLPTYFQVSWPEAGFAPDEVDETVLVGQRVRIRPRFEHADFVFGDGSSSGPTASLGGPYPDGDIVHTYQQAGQMDVRVDVMYGGEFSVAGGEWMEIPGQVLVQGTPFQLRVAEARARLYTE